jgi:Asp-tRNA(Asn)/Glu-tRNA(Gln) amidotransferase C subunit
MPVEIDIAHVARLARLELSDEELERLPRPAGGDPRARRPGAGVSRAIRRSRPLIRLGLENVFREDLVTPHSTARRSSPQAPEARDGFFVVPPALEL